jgi:peroxiredoxin
MAKLSITKVFILILTMTFSSLTGAELEVGDIAPDFTLPHASQDTINFDGVTLSNFQGRSNVVLVFYAADWSPGCTTQMRTFRDNFSDFGELDAEVLAISGDYVFAHKAWIEAEGFQFKLVSDHLHKVARMYKSYRPDIAMNKRTVYVIDKEGNISYINQNYEPGNQRHFSALTDHLTSLEEESEF